MSNKTTLLNMVWDNRAAFTKEQTNRIVALVCYGHKSEAESEISKILASGVIG